jgi:periplasmic divalent cation tolerance protein
MTDKRIVLSTTASQEEARKIAHALVEQKIAACVTIVPSVESIYRWEGKVETAQEWLLIIKSIEPAWERLYKTVCDLHSYEVPELVVLGLLDGNPAYLRWIGDSVR